MVLRHMILCAVLLAAGTALVGCATPDKNGNSNEAQLSVTEKKAKNRQIIKYLLAERARENAPWDIEVQIRPDEDTPQNRDIFERAFHILALDGCPILREERHRIDDVIVRTYPRFDESYEKSRFARYGWRGDVVNISFMIRRPHRNNASLADGAWFDVYVGGNTDGGRGDNSGMVILIDRIKSFCNRPIRKKGKEEFYAVPGFDFLSQPQDITRKGPTNSVSSPFKISFTNEL